MLPRVIMQGGQSTAIHAIEIGNDLKDFLEGEDEIQGEEISIL